MNRVVYDCQDPSPYTQTGISMPSGGEPAINMFESEMPIFYQP